MDHRILKGRNALVTGAGRNVGRGIALALAREGCNVVVNYRDASGREEAEAVVGEIQAIGVEAFSVEGDVSDAGSVTAMFAEVAGRVAKLDLLVNNAGTQVWKALLDLTEDDWDSVMDTNVKGCFLCTQAAARWMKETGGGAIVNIGSGCNKLAFPRLVSYVASKGSIEMFTKVAAVELGGFGIRVNCVAPGSILTDRTLIEDPLYREKWGAITPLGRIGTPEDVGRSVVYFASELAEFVTGQTVWVDGGVFTRAPWPY